MQHKFLPFDQTLIQIEYPESFTHFADILYSGFDNKAADNPCTVFKISEVETSLYNLYENDLLRCENLTGKNMSINLMNEVIRCVAENVKNHIAIHAAAVTNQATTILLPGNTGAGKTSLTSWLISQGYQYLTDELVLLESSQNLIQAFYRPLNIKPSGLSALKPLLKNFDQDKELDTQSVIVWPETFIGESADHNQAHTANLILFPNYQKQSDLIIEPLSPGEAGLALMGSNVSARNHKDHGFRAISKFAKNTPAIKVTYSHFAQLETLLPELINLLSAQQVSVSFLKSLTNSSPSKQSKQLNEQQAKVNDIPAATIYKNKKKLCIGMATYDDYDGVYFSTQAIRLYHPEITDDSEILIIDNNPTGKCAHALKNLDKQIDDYRYQPLADVTGTAVRDKIFEYTDAEFVLCIDSHVMLYPGAIKKLLDYYEANPHTKDLLQGPMFTENLSQWLTHFKPTWNQGMYGIWGQDDRADDIDGQAFDIPMQGLGLFSCRRGAWPGFNPKFRGFGGEEGYIHEKFRQAGGRTLCLPFLRWLHRFDRPMGVPYPINWPDRINNYLLGFSELGLDTSEVIEHFRKHVGEETTDRVVESFKLKQAENK